MRIAIIRLSALGDVIVSSSMLAGLKLMQECQIEWFVDERFAGVLEHSPYITKIHSLPFKKLLKSLTGILNIRSYMKNCGQYDIVIDMQGLIKSACIGKCLMTKKFVGFSKEGCREWLASYFYTHKVSINYDANILERNFQVLFSHMDKFQESPFDISKVLQVHSQSLGIHYRNLDSELMAIFRTNNHNDKKTFKFLFILEASIPEKIYPIKNYALLASKLATFLPDSEFFLIWHDNLDNANNLLDMLKKQGLKGLKLPKLDLNALKFIMKQMDCVIGGDTGITHLAWAMGTPSITLYGNNNKTSSKNMRDTRIERVLLGNPYLVSTSNNFEISSISADSIFTLFKHKIYERIIEENRTL
ncbi:lipopolysaccharide heptosyltransferase I [Helicobacter aurati]|uniref:Lipopolysaccharide heptosyltransferase 1 n=1 Tax=Helicobacter aurati TaxID=137778 RepID=A0A3D8J7B1_9HELI|nr:lipopolysaccharide heptosyltransferase I [Helicobacter aurati]RDU73085.1 lipopolysaccharide heptosyltransferase I [Helicobacter aurati]